MEIPLAILFVIGIIWIGWGLGGRGLGFAPSPGTRKVTRHPNGKLATDAIYRDGKLDGPYVSRYAEGGVESSCTFRRGKLEGPYTRRYRSGPDDGQREIECHYVGDRKEGLSTTWSSDGVKLWDGFYHNDRLHGPHRRYDATGRVVEVLDYVDGRVVRVTSLIDHRGRQCVLDQGPIQVWKIATVCVAGVGTPYHDHDTPNAYVRLLVPAEARRVTVVDDGAQHYKSRVEFAVVEDIVDRWGTHHRVATSCVHKGTQLVYRVGETVVPDGFDADPNVDCGAGIHVHKYVDHCDVW